ncbi:MAG: pantothenate kinase [Leptolyngbya sp. DLM2.Bin27]|nr:MAG: pantothenate kinase [Leptolyngbya sp. DLM2.Bin27]
MDIGQRPPWLALIMGNSRWHWGAFEDNIHSSTPGGDRCLGTWHTPHLTKDQVDQLKRGGFAPEIWQQWGLDLGLTADLFYRHSVGSGCLDLWVASVVAASVAWWADYPALYRVETAQVPLKHTYASLGVDRALALVGAGEIWGWPVLVIDCGTAMTFTAGVDGGLMGGAILPGLRSQFRTLHTATDQLPALDLDPNFWPQRWATDTATAITSGILHSQLAGIRDFIAAWQADWPTGLVVFTGGDSGFIIHHIKQQTPALTQRIKHDPDLGFWGLRVCRRQYLERQ